MLAQLQEIDPENLTASETAEITRIINNVDVVAYVILDMKGRELASGGTWSDMLAPILANALDLAHRMGGEIGENDGCNMLFLDGPSFETISIALNSATAIFLKRKPEATRGRLHYIS